MFLTLPLALQFGAADDDCYYSLSAFSFSLRVAILFLDAIRFTKYVQKFCVFVCRRRRRLCAISKKEMIFLAIRSLVQISVLLVMHFGFWLARNVTQFRYR